MFFMRNLSNPASGKPFGKVINSVVFAALFLLASGVTTIHAADRKKETPVDITYVGTVNEKPVFQINFENTTGEEVFLSLTDENGNYIYSEVVKDGRYSRKIQLDNAELNEMKLKLTLRTKRNFQTQLFDINTNVRTVRDVQVIKL